MTTEFNLKITPKYWNCHHCMGDSIAFISKALDVPHDRVNFYIEEDNRRDWFRKGNPPKNDWNWWEDFNNILNFSAKPNKKLILHPKGTKLPKKVIAANYNISETYFDPKRPVKYAQVNPDMLSPDKNLLEDIPLNYDRTIVWSRRTSCNTVRGNKGFLKIPQFFLEKYKDYNFINIGTPSSVGETEWGSVLDEGRASDLHRFNLHTTLYLMDK